MARNKTDITYLIEKRFFRYVYHLVYATGIMDVAHHVGQRLEEGYFLPHVDAKGAERLKPVRREVQALADDGTYDAVDVYAIGQSHIDAAWLWRWVDTVKKCRITFKHALHHIATIPHFTFSQSQAAYFWWMQLYAPELFRLIQAAVREGRFELVGGDWVEMDANLPSGEAFVRQRLVGQRYFLAHFGRLATIEWLPDTFGYAWTLPQILVKSGARYFYTTKLTWNKDTEFPFRTFWWEGPDGTRILAHVTPMGWGRVKEVADHVRRNRLLAPGETLVASYADDFATLASKFSDEHIRAMGVFYGMGDGGHGPQPHEVAFMRDLEKAGVLRQAPAATFFSAVDKVRDRLPVWRDEMYLETHRGTLTTQAWVKRANRKAECLLEMVEKFSALADVVGKAYPTNELQAAWRNVLFNQFHDVLPGSSIPEVYADHRREFEANFRTLTRLKWRALRFLASNVNTLGAAQGAGFDDRRVHAITVFNALSWPRTDRVTVQLPHLGEWAVRTRDGTGVPAQPVIRTKQGEPTHYLVFVAEDVPALGYRTYFLEECLDGPRPRGAKGAGAVAGTGTGITSGAPGSFPHLPVEETADGAGLVIQTEDYKVTVDKYTGYVDSVQVVTGPGNRTVEALAGFGNVLRVFAEDHPEEDAWNLDPDYRQKERTIPPPTSLKVTENGPVFTRVQVTRAINKSRVIQEVTLYRGVPRVEFTTRVAWHETHTLLKVGFETRACADALAAEIPYGHIDRPTWPERPHERARFEVCGHKWVALADPDTNSGVLLANDCKYGYSVERENADAPVTVLMTLLRGAQYPFDQLPASIRRFLPRPIYTDQGHHLVKYALVPHAGTWQATHAWRAGWELNYPLLAVVESLHAGVLPSRHGFLDISVPNVFASAVKPPEPRLERLPGDLRQLPEAQTLQLVVRLVEVEGRDTAFTLRTPAGLEILAARATDLLELNPEPLPVDDPHALALVAGPHEILTVVLDLQFEMS